MPLLFTDFEKAAVKIQRGMEKDLTRPEKTQVRHFLLNDTGEVKEAEEADGEVENEAIKLLQEKRVRKRAHIQLPT